MNWKIQETVSTTNGKYMKRQVQQTAKTRNGKYKKRQVKKRQVQETASTRNGNYKKWQLQERENNTQLLMMNSYASTRRKITTLLRNSSKPKRTLKKDSILKPISLVIV